MAKEHLLLLLSSLENSQYLDRTILGPAGFRVTCVDSLHQCEAEIKSDPPDLIIFSDHLNGTDLILAAGRILQRYPFIPIILLPDSPSNDLAIRVINAGFTGYIQPPVKSSELLQAIRTGLLRRKNWESQARLVIKKDTKDLQKRLSTIETIEQIGRKITSSLDLDKVLEMIVDAAVDLTGAEEGSLLMVHEPSGELFIRASRNFHEDFVKTFRLPVTDSLAGKVLRSGKPLVIDVNKPQRIKTAYLVHNLVYMPIFSNTRVIGVLGVDNRQSGKPFSEYHMVLLSALSDYASIALENARLFARSESERTKLETILSGIEEGVVVVDQDGRIILVNKNAREAFSIQEKNPIGMRLQDVIQNQYLLDVMLGSPVSTPTRLEIVREDGRVMNTQITPIDQVGLVVIMQDITHLKELDQIKSDFVNAVSHDLRSPLTAILGYVELIEKVGEVTSLQQDFIKRIRLSVHNITALINDLLDLGRIEAGFDIQKEITSLPDIINISVDGIRKTSSEKEPILTIDIVEPLPPVLGNPIRLRQMLTNLLTNAIKYSGKEGIVNLSVKSDAGQIFIQVSDNGFGIPSTDQPYIFDKFYRGSNTPSDTPGSGLGLAIVKSIVENHNGRIWVDSTVGQGASFTVVLPAVDQVI